MTIIDIPIADIGAVIAIIVGAVTIISFVIQGRKPVKHIVIVIAVIAAVVCVYTLPSETNEDNQTIEDTSVPSNVVSRSYSKLTNCKMISNSNNSGASRDDVTIGDFKDFFGNTYSAALSFWVADSYPLVGIEYADFDLSKEYLVISGYIAARNISQPGAEMAVHIYADGDEIYRSKAITNSTHPVYFCINVEDISILRIECVTNEAAHGYCIVDAELECN